MGIPKTTTISAFGHERTISDQQVLIARPKPGRKIDADGRTSISNDLKGALETV